MRLSLVVAAGVETLFHCALELVGDLAVTVSMEDGPVLELHLGEHLALNLTVNLTGTLFDVEAGRSTTSISTHQEITSVVLETTKLLRILVEFEVPCSLLFFALLVGLEVVHQVLDLFNLCFSIGMHDLG